MTATETPVLDTLADITAISLERCALPPRELMLARIAALIAVDAPPASYLANAGAAADSGITGDDIQAIMIGIAPVVGTTKVVASAGNIFRALGFAIMAAEAEMAEASRRRAVESWLGYSGSVLRPGRDANRDPPSGSGKRQIAVSGCE